MFFCSTTRQYQLHLPSILMQLALCRQLNQYTTSVLFQLQGFTLLGMKFDCSDLIQFNICFSFFQGFTFAFLVEVLIKLTAYSPKDFVSNGWNLFDSVIVVVSLADLFISELLPGLTILRAFRLVSHVSVLSKIKTEYLIRFQLIACEKHLEVEILSPNQG